MANQPGTFTGTQGSTGTGHSAAVQGHSTGQTGVGDATYNLISVVYHALQGAETYKKYEEDVERTQDSELAQFFRQACEEEKRRAQQGKELLARHLQRNSGGSGGGQQLQGGRSSQQSASGSRSGHQSQSGSSSAQMGSGSSGRSQQSHQGGSSSVQFGSSPRSASLSDSNKSGRSER